MLPHSSLDERTYQPKLSTIFPCHDIQSTYILYSLPQDTRNASHIKENRMLNVPPTTVYFQSIFNLLFHNFCNILYQYRFDTYISNYHDNKDIVMDEKLILPLRLGCKVLPIRALFRWCGGVWEK